MRLVYISLFLSMFSLLEARPSVEANKLNNRSSIYTYWGWNGSAFTPSNIHFYGEGYDFTLKRVKAKHRPTKLGISDYLGIQHLTIPQYNFRVGYYIKDGLDVSFGVDHMKYVMVQDQTVQINGEIGSASTSYRGVYNGGHIALSTDFLTFEHTDGLNYLNLAIRKSFALAHTKRLKLSGFLGSGLGAVVPRSNIQLLGKTRHDAWHFSGWGIDVSTGLKLGIGKRFFIQSEIKTGFIHMPDITTSYARSDRASQAFGYAQSNILFGLDLPLIKAKQ